MTAIGSGAAIFGCAGPVLTPQEPVTLLLHIPAGHYPDRAVESIGAASHWADDAAGIRPLKSHFARLTSCIPLQAGADGVPQHAGAARSWSAVRCTSPDRLPIAGPVAAAELPGLWTCTAMGARGLTLAG
mgnify:CR=1 FL=1